MNIDKYIKWEEIWEKEVDINTMIDYLDDENLINLLKHFIKDVDIELIINECSVNDDNLLFFFGEGGKSEGDSQGWSRDYVFTVDSDFMIVNGIYSQG